jgi:DNA-binding transcriptional ArsR family regulator
MPDRVHSIDARNLRSSEARSIRFDIANFAELLSEPSRVAMLLSLMHGLQRPASELAALAGVSQPTASEHLRRLVAGSLLRVEQRGRHRYFELRGPEVAEAIEALALHAPPRKPARPPDAERLVFLNARTCYQHLAGKQGVALLEALQAAQLVRHAPEGVELTASGIARCAEAGLKAARWPSGKTCLDWTERRMHLGGPLGSLLAQEMFRCGWIARHGDGRAVRVTARGEKGFAVLGQNAVASATARRNPANGSMRSASTGVTHRCATCSSDSRTSPETRATNAVSRSTKGGMRSIKAKECT